MKNSSYLCNVNKKQQLEPGVQGYRHEKVMKKTIRCTAKQGVSMTAHEDLQCFVSLWGMAFDWCENDKATVITADEDEIDGLLMNEKWVTEKFNVK